MGSSMVPEDRFPTNGKIGGLRGPFHILMRNSTNDQLLEKAELALGAVGSLILGMFRWRLLAMLPEP